MSRHFERITNKCTNQGTFDRIYQLPCGREMRKRIADRVKNEPVVYVAPNGHARFSRPNAVNVTAFMRGARYITSGD